MAADPGSLVVHLERVLPAPPSVVFAASTRPDRLAQWWGPRGFTAPSIELDLRVGGRYGRLDLHRQGWTETLDRLHRLLSSRTGQGEAAQAPA